jgi:hypothetical protein
MTNPDYIRIAANVYDSYSTIESVYSLVTHNLHNESSANITDFLDARVLLSPNIKHMFNPITGETKTYNFGDALHVLSYNTHVLSSLNPESWIPYNNTEPSANYEWYIYTKNGSGYKNLISNIVDAGLPTEYTYTFEINVQQHDASVNISHIIANDVSLDAWGDALVSVTALIESNRDTAGQINRLTIPNAQPVSWLSITAQGDKLFQIVTKEKVTKFDISPHRPKYAPGWKIYENDQVVLQELSNRGLFTEPANDNGMWYYTYDLTLENPLVTPNPAAWWRA